MFPTLENVLLTLIEYRVNYVELSDIEGLSFIKRIKLWNDLFPFALLTIQENEIIFEYSDDWVLARRIAWALSKKTGLNVEPKEVAFENIFYPS